MKTWVLAHFLLCGLLIVGETTVAGMTTLDRYLQEMAQESLQPLTLPAPTGITAGNPVHRAAPPTPVPFRDKGPFTLLNARHVEGLPVLDLEGPAGKFTARFHEGAATDLVANAILKTLDLPHLPKFQPKQILVQVPKLPELIRFWAKAPVSLEWGRYFTITSATPSTLTITGAILEPAGWPNIQSTWNFRENLSQTQRQLLLTLSWLQCPNLEPKLHHARLSQPTNNEVVTDLTNCLGYTLTSASPNLMSQRWLKSHSTDEKARVQLNSFFQDPAYRAAFSRLTEADVRQWLQKSAAISASHLQQVFQDVGYPEGLARFYTQKLLLRRNDLAKLYGETQTAVDETPITDGEQIVDGDLVVDYPGFVTDRTRSTMEKLFYLMIGDVVTTLDETAKKMIAGLPFTELGSFQAGQHQIGLSGGIRLKRKVERNELAVRPEEAWRVTDQLFFGFAGGPALSRSLGIPFLKTELSMWGNIGPGWNRIYVATKLVGSQAEAEKNFWLLPYQLVIQKSFDTLAPGESLAIQDSMTAGIVAGGTATVLKEKTVKPNAMIMGVQQWSTATQVHKDLDGKLTFIEGTFGGQMFNAKGFWRIFNRFFRIPIAKFGYRRGTQSQSIFHFDELANPPQSDLEKAKVELALSEAVRLQDSKELRKILNPRQVESDLSKSSWFWDLFYRQRSQDSLSRSETETGVDLPTTRYHINSTDNLAASDSESSKYESSCNFGGALALAPELERAHDGYLLVDCTDEQPNKTTLREGSIAKFVSQRLGLSLKDLSYIFFDETGDDKPVRLNFRREWDWTALAPLLNIDEATERQVLSSAVSSFSIHAPPPDAEDRFANIREKMKELRPVEQRVIFDNFRALFALKDPRERMDFLIDLLRGKRAGGFFKDAFFTIWPGGRWRVSGERSGEHSLQEMSRERIFGTVRTGAAAERLRSLHNPAHELLSE